MEENKQWVPYTPEEREASNKYSMLKQRSKAKGLELIWKRGDFISWYKKVPKKCYYYCGCALDDIQRFWEINDSKRKVTRGRSFEINRLKDESYSENNCVLACYWRTHFPAFMDLGRNSVLTVSLHAVDPVIWVSVYSCVSPSSSFVWE